MGLCPSLEQVTVLKAQWDSAAQAPEVLWVGASSRRERTKCWLHSADRWALSGLCYRYRYRSGPAHLPAPARTWAHPRLLLDLSFAVTAHWLPSSSRADSLWESATVAGPLALLQILPRRFGFSIQLLCFCSCCLLVFAFCFIGIQRFKTWALAFSPESTSNAFKVGRNLGLSKYVLPLRLFELNIYEVYYSSSSLSRLCIHVGAYFFPDQFCCVHLLPHHPWLALSNLHNMQIWPCPNPCPYQINRKLLGRACKTCHNEGIFLLSDLLRDCQPLCIHTTGLLVITHICHWFETQYFCASYCFFWNAFPSFLLANSYSAFQNRTAFYILVIYQVRSIWSAKAYVSSTGQ